MTGFEKEYFQKQKFTPGQIAGYMDNARRDLMIAQKDPFPEVQFTYAYQALIKAGIALIAQKGGVKVRSVPGHHIKILIQLSRILADDEVFTIGNAMRMKRNQDLYSGGGEFVSKKEAKEYAAFTAKVLGKVAEFMEGI
jgi:hypothetical protein